MRAVLFSRHTPSIDDVEQSLEVCFLLSASLPYANTRTCIKKNVCCSPLEVLFFWNIYAHNAFSRATTIFFLPLLWRRIVSLSVLGWALDSGKERLSKAGSRARVHIQLRKTDLVSS